MNTPVSLPKRRPHDLSFLIHQAASKIALEYERMRQHAMEDPGTSGDQAEDNWAELLRQWLPAGFHVATKGRIISSSGRASRQMDVVVLSPYYPQGLITNKIYIAAGVLAAFECKRTLQREHIRKAAKTSADLGELTRSDKRVPHQIIYGILAHSHRIASKQESPVAVIEKALIQADEEEISDPRDCLDFICVPSLGTWSLMRLPMRMESGLPCITTSYMSPAAGYSGLGAQTDALARFLTGLLRRLGHVDRSIALIAEYFDSVGLFGTGAGQVRQWPLEDIPDDLTKPVY